MRSKQYTRIKSYDKLGRRTYIMRDPRGGSFFGSLGKKFKRGASKLFQYAKPILSNSAKELAPVLATSIGNKLLSEASKRGVSDNIVNLGSKANQYVGKQIKDKYKPQKQDIPQQVLSNFISDRSQELLANILGNGHGRGLRGVGLRGVGLKGLSGSGPFNQSAPTMLNR